MKVERALISVSDKAGVVEFARALASLGVQIHGGMGYIEETGAAQHMRDARIAAIYEGANGVQAIDLVLRKLPLSNGATVAREISEMRAIATEAAAKGGADFGAAAPQLPDRVAPEGEHPLLHRQAFPIDRRTTLQDQVAHPR